MSSTIMVVDDEPLILETIALSLQDEGFRVLSASSGLMALSLLHAHPETQLVISDTVMFEMSGPSLIQKMKLLPLHSEILTILTSGLPENEACDASLGHSAFLRKPFRLKEMLNLVHHVLLAGQAEGDRTN